MRYKCISFQVLFGEIEKVNEKAKLVLPSFKEMLYKVSYENKGDHAKCGLKLPEDKGSLFRVLIRIMEKMFKKEFSDKNRQVKIMEKVEKELETNRKSSMQDVVLAIMHVWIA